MLFIDVKTRVLGKYTIPIVNPIMLMSYSTKFIHSLTQLCTDLLCAGYSSEYWAKAVNKTANVPALTEFPFR